MENNFNEKYDQGFDEANKDILDKEKSEMEKQNPSKVKNKDEASKESEEDKKKDSRS